MEKSSNIIDLTKTIKCSQAGCNAAFFLDKKGNEYLWVASAVDYKKIDKKEVSNDQTKVYIGDKIYLVPSYLTYYNMDPKSLY